MSQVPIGNGRSVNKDESKTVPSPQRSRPYLGITFKCCRVYWRIYLAADGKRFSGHCPKCGFPVHVEVSRDGTESSFFEV